MKISFLQYWARETYIDAATIKRAANARQGNIQYITHVEPPAAMNKRQSSIIHRLELLTVVTLIPSTICWIGIPLKAIS